MSVPTPPAVERQAQPTLTARSGRRGELWHCKDRSSFHTARYHEAGPRARCMAAEVYDLARWPSPLISAGMAAEVLPLCGCCGCIPKSARAASVAAASVAAAAAAASAAAPASRAALAVASSASVERRTPATAAAAAAREAPIASLLATSYPAVSG